MKRVFNLTHPKIKPARLVDSAKHEVKKYMKKERARPLEPGVDYWDFEVKFGKDEASAQPIHPKEINQYMDNAEQNGEERFFVDIQPIAGVRSYVAPFETVEELSSHAEEED